MRYDDVIATRALSLGRPPKGIGGLRGVPINDGSPTVHHFISHTHSRRPVQYKAGADIQHNKRGMEHCYGKYSVSYEMDIGGNLISTRRGSYRMTIIEEYSIIFDKWIT